MIHKLGQCHLGSPNNPFIDSSMQRSVPFDWCEGEVTFTEMWASALQLGIVRSNFVNSRNCRCYLFAERSLGCFPMSWRIRQHAARVRGVSIAFFLCVDDEHYSQVESTVLVSHGVRGAASTGVLCLSTQEALLYRSAFLAKDMPWFRRKHLNT